MLLRGEAERVITGARRRALTEVPALKVETNRIIWSFDIFFGQYPRMDITVGGGGEALISRYPSGQDHLQELFTDGTEESCRLDGVGWDWRISGFHIGWRI